MIIFSKHLCPVCGKHTFSHHDSFEICPICGWEDDGYQFNHPDDDGGANYESLNDFRKRWQEKQADKKALMEEK